MANEDKSLDYTDKNKFTNGWVKLGPVADILKNQFNSKSSNLSNGLFGSWEVKSFNIPSVMNILSYVKRGLNKIGFDPYEIVVSHGSNNFDIYNFLFYYCVVIPKYLPFLDEAAGHLTSIFRGNRDLLESINKARKKKVDNEIPYLKVKKVLFSKFINKYLFFFTIGLNIVFNSVVLIYNYFLSTFIQIKLNNSQDPFSNFSFKNNNIVDDDEATKPGEPKTQIFAQDFFNVFVAPFDNLRDMKALEKTLSNLSYHPIFSKMPEKYSFLNFFLLNGIVWSLPLLSQRIIDWATKKLLKGPTTYNNLYEPFRVLFEGSDYSTNFNTPKEVFTKINYINHIRAPFYLIFMVWEYRASSKLLELQLKSILDKTEEQFREAPINFDQKSFPIGSLRYFFLDDQPNKKKVFQLVKKWKKLMKKNSINFKNFPSESLIILGEIGSGKTTMMHIMINYVEKLMEIQKIKMNKAIFSGRVPVLKNLLKKDELKEVILKALQKAFKSDVNLMVIEDIDQVLPNRSNNINISSYMSINTYLINVNVGEGNAEKGYSGIILGTAQKAKNLDSAVIRRSSFVIVNIRNKKRLKKMLIVKFLLTELQNSEDNYEKYFILKNFKSDVHHILKLARFQETYKIFYLLNKSIIYLRFFVETLDNISQTIEEQKKIVDTISIKKMINGEIFDQAKLYSEQGINIALYNYCNKNVVFNKDTMTKIMTEASIV
jgi:energy-coupling factor transporter ATP-binding protein EcfA2